MFVYIHIPFCESKCKYCRFASIGNTQRVMVQKYVAHLIQDIKNFQRPVCNTGLLRSIYFGGGTPSILEKNDLERIIHALKEKFGDFGMDIEITLETTPKNLTPENIQSWEDIGINRVSIGVQTLNDMTLQIIGRDDKETILSGLSYLKESNLKNISVDCIIGLPGTKPGDVVKDIDTLLSSYSFINHISVYMLEDYYLQAENDSRFENITYPEEWKTLCFDESLYQSEYLKTQKYLESKGFERYEISNFAKEKKVCHHNQAYWEHKTVIGFGLGSHSYVDNIRYAYKDDFLGYYKGELAYKEELSEGDIILEKILFGFRTKGIEKEIIPYLDQEKLKVFLEEKRVYEKNGYLCISDDSIAVLDQIIYELIQ